MDIKCLLKWSIRILFFILLGLCSWKCSPGTQQQQPCDPRAKAGWSPSKMVKVKNRGWWFVLLSLKEAVDGTAEWESLWECERKEGKRSSSIRGPGAGRQGRPMGTDASYVRLRPSARAPDTWADRLPAARWGSGLGLGRREGHVGMCTSTR